MADCLFVAKDGATAYRTAAGVTVTMRDGSSFFCSTHSGGLGIEAQRYWCEDFDVGGTIFAAASRKDGDNDLLVFYNEVWYLDRCEDPPR